jgi:hypothetical protein
MQPLLALLLSLLPFTTGGVGTLTCTPRGYSQAEGGEVYQRVDCVAARSSNAECRNHILAIDKLKADARTFSYDGKLPDDQGLRGRLLIEIDRSTGDYKLIVTAIDARIDFKNVKTFRGRCTTTVTEPVGTTGS